VGATHTLTDAAYLADYFLQKKSKAGVVAIPATVDGNIHHSYIASSLGFDTASKIYS
jgi:diphosphate--fructose-6-phosphate 1-phosphotransferase